MKTITIGRGDGCQIFIDDDLISRRHAILKISTFGKMEIVDMGKNGTFVNGIRLRPNVPVPVKRKDIISFANVSQLDWKQVPNPGIYYKIGAIVLGVLLLLLVGLIIYRNVAASTPQQKPATNYEYYEESTSTAPETPSAQSPIQDSTGTQKPKDKDDTADKKKDKEDDLKGKSVKDLEFAPTPKPAAPKTPEKKDKGATKDAGKKKPEQKKPEQEPKKPAQKNNNQNVIM